MQVTGAISPALERVKLALFRPFDIGKWLACGFVFFLASLVAPVGGYSGRFDLPRRSSAPLPELGDLPPDLAQHASTIAIVGALGFVIAVAIGIVLAWVGARGLMMAYRSVAMGYVAIGESWRETAKPANALF